MKNTLRRFLGPKVKNWIRSKVSFEGYDIKERQKMNPFFGDEPFTSYEDSPVKLGIIIDEFQYHKDYIAACRDLRISYQLIDLASASWIEEISVSNCDGFLVWPSARNSVVKTMFDDRLAFLVKEMGFKIFPELKECWIYENKLRTAYWLKTNHVPHPQTDIFYREEDAIAFLKKCRYPIVFKSNLGATASGVRILRERKAALKLVKGIFREGFLPRAHNKYDRQRGFIIFQEFLLNIKEWRLVRIGDNYFGYQKMQVGDFHSGSHEILLERPSNKLLNFLKEVTDKGGFKSMDVDVFETDEGFLYVNELQTVFGTGGLLKAAERMPEMNERHFLENGQWKTEKGDFFRNGFCNIRVKELLKKI